ncbi:NAD(P)-dependent alcohol dehydrogenase [Actinoplanes sp. NPDC051494]|uniref:NAD(P)-dependent alcohol dehydrogenase n=1 Tax=Actinoplanes sp. NPDC051494 TaxID=3363907 RepID=UPI0037B27E74
MKATQIFSYGAPDVLRISEVDVSVPGPGEVLVRVGASSVNGHDALVRAGAVKIVSGRKFPIGVGLDFAGVVAGTDEPVWGLVHPREKHVLAGCAEYVVVPADRIGAMPPGVSAAQAAALVVPGVTAVQALRDATGLAAGESVLVRGAAGGVGAAVVQLAHAFGARVTALARTGQQEALTELGAERVLDYRTTTAGQLGHFDVVVDTVGTDLARYRRLLGSGGRMVTVGLSGGAIAAIAASTVHGSRRIRTFSANPGTQRLDEVAALVGAGSLRPVIAEVHPLDDVAQAHRAFEKGGVLGRQVVTM